MSGTASGCAPPRSSLLVAPALRIRCRAPRLLIGGRLQAVFMYPVCASQCMPVSFEAQ